MESVLSLCENINCDMSSRAVELYSGVGEIVVLFFLFELFDAQHFSVSENSGYDIVYFSLIHLVYEKLLLQR